MPSNQSKRHIRRIAESNLNGNNDDLKPSDINALIRAGFPAPITPVGDPWVQEDGISIWVQEDGTSEWRQET